jgi:hypothetical protein
MQRLNQEIANEYQNYINELSMAWQGRGIAKCKAFKGKGCKMLWLGVREFEQKLAD